MKTETRTCPVCGSLLREPPTRAPDVVDTTYYDCFRCGRYGLTWQASQYVDAWKNEAPRGKPRGIYRNQSNTLSTMRTVCGRSLECLSHHR